MIDEEISRPNNKGRRLWDHHGSWLLLGIVGVSCFMAGSQFTASHANNNLRTVVEAHAAQDADRVRRIRELIDTNTQLTIRLGDKVEVAAERATEAVSKAEKVVEQARTANDIPHSPDMQ